MLPAVTAGERQPASKRSSDFALFAFTLLTLALAAALHWPALSSGFVADDYLQLAMLDGDYPVARSPLDLYAFVRGRDELGPLMDRGVFPWWSHPELRLSAFRPLSSASIWLDHSLLGLSAAQRHVHSLLWLGATLAAFAWLSRALLPRLPAAIATLILAVDPSFVSPVGWLANRTTLISAFFGLIALGVHVRRREGGRRSGGAVTALAFTAALAGGEYALSLLAYAIAWEICAGRGDRRARGFALWPWLVPALAYFLGHVALGHGAVGSAVYVDPIASPGKFAFAIATRWPALLASELLLLPSELLHGAIVTGFVGVVVLLLPLLPLAWAARRALSEEPPALRRTMLALMLGTALSLIPLVGTLPSARLLVVPSIGGALLIASFVWAAAKSLRRQPRRVGAWLAGAVAAGFALLHIGLAPLSTLAASIGFRETHATLKRVYLDAEFGPGGPGSMEVLANAVEPVSLIYPPWVRHAEGAPLPDAWRVLSITPHPQTLTRTATNAIELEVHGGAMLGDPVSALFRGLETPLQAGQVVQVKGMTVRVVEMDVWGPRKVHYTFDRPLDAQKLTALIDGPRFRRVAFPAKGQSIEVPGALPPARP